MELMESDFNFHIAFVYAKEMHHQVFVLITRLGLVFFYFG